MTIKKKKSPCFTEYEAERTGYSQKTIQNRIRVGEVIELGLKIIEYKDCNLTLEKWSTSLF